MVLILLIPSHYPLSPKAITLGYKYWSQRHRIAFMKYTLIALSLAALLTACGQKSASEYLQSANLALAKQDYATAVIELKNAVKTEPNNANSRFLLGGTYLALGQYEAAEKELERAMEYGHPANEVIPLLSKVYQRQGKSKGLFELTAKAKGLKPKGLAQLKLYQVQDYVSKGSNEKAKALIDELKRIKRGAEFSQLALVYELILKQQLDAALLQLEHILTSYPNQQDALKLKAQLYLNTSQPDLATETYEQYIGAYPDEVDTRFFLARLYSELNQTDKAEPIVNELLRNYPEQPLLLQLKASARLNQQDLPQALMLAEKALRLNPEDTTSRLIAGVSAYLSRNFESSQNHFSLVASVLRPNHPALRMLADSQLRLGMSLEANETVQRFETISEQDASLLSGVGHALLRQGEINKAKAILSSASQPETLTTPEALANVASLKLSLSDVSGILDLEQALTKVQQSESTLTSEQIELGLAQAYFSTEQYDKALDIATRWQQSTSTESKIKGLIIAAKVFVKQNESSLAQKAYQQALALKPDSPGIQLALLNLAPMNTKLTQQAALDDVQAMLNQHPEYIPAILKHYLLTKLLKQPEQMTEYLSDLIDKHPSDKNQANTIATLQLVLGKMWLLEGKPDKAIILFEQVKAAHRGQVVSYWAQLAQAYIQTRQYDKASSLYQQWFEIQPNQVRAIVGMIKVFDGQGQVKKALKLSERYLNELGGNNLEVKLLQLHLLAKIRQYDKVQAGITTLPTHIQALPFVKGLIGQVQLAQQAPHKAELNLRSAYQSKPSPANVNLLLSAIYQTSGEPQALAFLKQHISQHPNDQASVLRYAQLQTGKNQTEAKTHYQQAIKLNSNNFIAHNNLANLFVAEQNLQQAYIHAQQALAIKPNEGQVLDTLGSIELKLGKYKQALKHIGAAVDLLHQDLSDEVKVNHIEALALNHDKKLARRKIAQYTLTDKTQQARLQKLKVLHQL